MPDYLLPASYVDMAVEFCHGTPDDRRKWLKIANRGINSSTGILSEFEVGFSNFEHGTAAETCRRSCGSSALF